LVLLYNISILFYAIAVRIAALFKEKARLFINGRKNGLAFIQARLAAEKRRRIWVHCASLGEFEQGRPVMEALKEAHPDLCIILTFFSPSGYEVKKNYHGADYIFYLPLDTKRNARNFVAIIDPVCALFVKYEFWYHYLSALYYRKIPTILFSAIFQPRHPFFKWYGSLHRRMLGFFRHIFVQDAESSTLLSSINITNTSIAGDTRFDRAMQVAEAERHYASVELFKNGHKLLVAGSTWKDDEILLKQGFENTIIQERYKLLIAPHETNDTHIGQIRELFQHKKICYWDEAPAILAQAEVCIVNSVGHLSFIYRYADAVWIGGGFTKTGIHNIIEPAIYGVPICFGPNYKRYREATEMIRTGAANSVGDSRGFTNWLKNEKALYPSGNSAKQYVLGQLGATNSILAYLEAEKCFFSTDKKL